MSFQSQQPPDDDARDGSSWGFSGWLNDEKVPNCPVCNQAFSMTFRRHHCKNCGGLVCGDCSNHWVRLPKNPTWGKVRVCDKCSDSIREEHTTCFEEDLAVNAEIIARIKEALKHMHQECDSYKMVLVKLEAEASGNSSFLEQYLKDPEGPDYNFEALRAKVQERWDSLMQNLEDQSTTRVQLEGRCLQARDRLREQKRKVFDLQVEKEKLEAQARAVDRARAERDELARQEALLEEEVAVARRQVQELEQQRLEEEQRQEELRNSWSLARLWGGGPPPRPQGGRPNDVLPTPFTISTGRQDPLLAVSNRSRLAGCRRRATTMVASATSGCEIM